MSKSKKIAFLGVMTALSMILSYVDSQIPIFPAIPGIKLGLANTVSVFLLYSIPTKEACTTVIARVVLSGLLFYGNVYHIAYSLCGALLSLCVMVVLKRTDIFSSVGVSIAGGVCHNIGQVCCAVIFTQTPEIFLYLPILLLCGTVSGALVGSAAAVILTRIK